MYEALWIVTLSLIVPAILYKVLPLKRVTIFEYQKGLKYNRGRYVAALNPGQHWFISTFTTVLPVDVRAEFLTIPGQDVLSSDGVSLKVSLAAEFQIIDANTAINKHANFRTSLYLSLQMALREIVGKEKIDTLIENRTGIGPKLMELTSSKAQALGLKLISADIKDIMFTGEMKKAFAQVIKAQKDGLAALERARGETAALRHLANAARSLNDNPSLLQLRALQSLGESSGNTLVLGVPNGAVPLAKSSAPSSKPSTLDSPDVIQDE